MIWVKRLFTNDFIEQVRHGNDIVSVISEYVPLKRRGQNYWGCCPFHNEKTPSFSVTPEKGFYYCFGCHASGDVFNFLMKEESIGFSEAVERLADRVQIPIPVAEKTEEDERKERITAELYGVNEMAGTFFYNCLTKTHYGQTALAYLRRRGLSDQTITDFNLGFAPDSWDKLSTAFLKSGINSTLLVTLGLAKEKNGKVYDSFRNRVIFPIYDTRDRIVGFGGRVLDDGLPKYLNSPETPIFNKRRLLFALNRAGKTIRDTEQAILVEGYMDVISAHNQGIKNVVASLGTAFTKDQARLLFRQAKELVLSYDMDTAGRNATLRAVDIVKGMGLQVKVASMPAGKDPDEYLRDNGPDNFLEVIKSAPNVLEYTLREALNQFDSSNLEGKVGIIGAVIPSLAQTENAVIIEGYIVRLAQLLKINESAIRSEFNKYLRDHKMTNFISSKTSPVGKQQAGNRETGSLAVIEENIIYMLTEHPDHYTVISDDIVPTDFKSEIRRSVFEKLKALYEKNNGTYTLTDIKEQLTPAESEELARIMMLDSVPDDATVLHDYAKRFRLAALREAYEFHSARADELNRKGDSAFIQELSRCKQVNEEMKKWL